MIKSKRMKILSSAGAGLLSMPSVIQSSQAAPVISVSGSDAKEFHASFTAPSHEEYLLIKKLDSLKSSPGKKFSDAEAAMAHFKNLTHD